MVTFVECIDVIRNNLTLSTALVSVVSGNIAYHAHTETSEFIYNANSRAAVDGYTNPKVEDGFCFLISEEGGWDSQVWWMVDFGLGLVHVIHNVTIFSEIWPDSYATWEKQLRNFTLAVSMNRNTNWYTCAHHPGYFHEPQKTLECHASGRFLKIENGEIINGSKGFAMCEVVVMGYKAIGK